jgi:hypothetical protein
MGIPPQTEVETHGVPNQAGPVRRPPDSKLGSLIGDTVRLHPGRSREVQDLSIEDGQALIPWWKLPIEDFDELNVSEAAAAVKELTDPADVRAIGRLPLMLTDAASADPPARAASVSMSGAPPCDGNTPQPRGDMRSKRVPFRLDGLVDPCGG